MHLLAAIALAAATEHPTDSFRAEHVEVKQHLAHVAEWVGGLQQATPTERKQTMGKVVAFLREHIVPHAQWEERVLYPLVDKQAGTGESNRFTAGMRYEHTIVGRSIDELAREAAKPTPDPVVFARRADNLLGLILAHFEVEEEVLLPVLDRSMSKAEVERALGPKAH